MSRSVADQQRPVRERDAHAGRRWPAPPLAAGSAGEVGELLFDGARWWLCLASGSPGAWREVAGPATAGTLQLLEVPVRVYDSRPGVGPIGVTKGKVERSRERTIDLRPAGLPGETRAALLDVTIVGPSSDGGYLKVFEPGAPVPSASAITWSAGGRDVRRSATIRVRTAGSLTLRCGGDDGAATDVIVDVAGYLV